MNLLDFTISTNVGEIRLCDLGSSHATEIVAPRADLRAAQFQFLVCLLQTAINPATEDDWANYWDAPPTEKDLRDSFEPVRENFELETSGPAFMQDLDSNFEANQSLPAEALFLENASAGHFVKKGIVNTLSPKWAALALFYLQSNSPAGGRGTRTGIRGGGPLTTFVVPPDNFRSLWANLWINVLSQDIQRAIGDPSAPAFPWMIETKISEDGSVAAASDCNPLYVLWGMPRRIRLHFSTSPGQCDLTQETCEHLVTGYKTRHGGNNYKAWVHPHSAYYFDPKEEKPPNSIKAQPGGVSYRHWSALCLAKGQDRQVADVVKAAVLRHRDIGSEGLRLWVSGYDVENAKVRCWYETIFPLYPTLSDSEVAAVSTFVGEFVDASSHCNRVLRKQVLVALTSEKTKTKPSATLLTGLQTRLLDSSEEEFFSLLQNYIKHVNDDDVRTQLRERWRKHLLGVATRIFDREALCGNTAATDYESVVKAREKMLKDMRTGKPMLKLRKGNSSDE